MEEDERERMTTTTNKNKNTNKYENMNNKNNIDADKVRWYLIITCYHNEENIRLFLLRRHHKKFVCRIPNQSH